MQQTIRHTILVMHRYAEFQKNIMPVNNMRYANDTYLPGFLHLLQKMLMAAEKNQTFLRRKKTTVEHAY